MCLGPRPGLVVAGAGAVVWVAASATPLDGGGAPWWAARAVLFAALVLVPVVLELVDPPAASSNRLARFARWMQPWTALLLVPAFVLPGGALAATLTVPWFALCLVLGVRGLLRMLGQPRLDAAEACCDIGFMALPVGGWWLLVARDGVSWLGFGMPLTLLTAMHFHFAGCLLSVVLGLSGRLLAPDGRTWRVYRVLAPLTCLGVGLVAFGIASGGWFGALCVVLYVLLAGASNGLMAMAVVPRVHDVVARSLLATGCAAGLIGLVIALLYALGRGLDLDSMAPVHGILLGLGWVGLSTVALARLQPTPHRAIEPPRLSSIRGGWRIGADFLSRRRLLGSGTPHGMLDAFAEYARPDLIPQQIDPRIRDFYEHTAAYNLRITPEWQPGWSAPARLYAHASRRVEQMNFPVANTPDAEALTSCILPVAPALDGRSNVRAWIRTYADTGRAIYVALYAPYVDGVQRLMHITFPLPGGNLASLLRLDSLPGAEGHCGLRLSTLPVDALHNGVQGVYLRLGWLSLRLPVNETICVWTSDMPESARCLGPLSDGAELLARHQIWLCGRHVLTLGYAVTRDLDAVRAD
ncbi:MAG: YndJ family transporter [Chloroflexi bacterium]|nr:YndJ family transporter [Chloroflexota bacterium]